MKIALICDRTLTSASAVAAFSSDAATISELATAFTTAQRALATAHEVLLITHDAEMEDRLLAFWPDIVINLVTEGIRLTDDTAIPALLERWHVPCTGSTLPTLQVCHDRSACRRVLRKHNLPIPVFMVVQSPEEVRAIECFPLSVKPLYDGDTLSLENEVVVHNNPALQARVRWVLDTYDQPALVETPLTGRELVVALLGNGSTVEVLPFVALEALALPAGSLAVMAGTGASASSERREARYRCPIEVSAELAQRITMLARQAFLALECRDFCEILMRLDAEAQPYILDISPHPSLLPLAEPPSAFLTAAAAAQMTYAELICQIWRLACARYGLTV
jgi:D-alanine-D-alanine ligase